MKVLALILSAILFSVTPVFGCTNESLKFDSIPADLQEGVTTLDGYSWYTVTGQTAWDLYKAALRRAEGPYVGDSPLPLYMWESSDHLMIVDTVNKFVFVLELEV